VARTFLGTVRIERWGLESSNQSVGAPLEKTKSGRLIEEEKVPVKEERELAVLGPVGRALAVDRAVLGLAALAAGLMLQAALLSVYLGRRDPGVLAAIVRAWRPSLFAGFMGALASQVWLLAFALATAVNGRTLALVEVLFAQAISRFAFKQVTTAREAVGIVLIVAGVVLLLWAH
jgi:drug/metabolite transporter (DMT)-like permease